MASCKECIHYEVCRALCKSEEELMPCVVFKYRSHFVELPFPISEGTKLRYIFKDESGRIRAGEDWETVTRVCKDGFYVSGRLDSDGTYQQGDNFYPWGAIGTEYFFTLKEAEQTLKELEENA